MTCPSGMSATLPCHKKLNITFEAPSTHTFYSCFLRSEEKPYVAPVQPSSYSTVPRVSRLNGSLLRYSPGQYTTMLRSNITQDSVTSTTQTSSSASSSSYVLTSHENEESESTLSATSELSSTSPRARTSPSLIYTPFMKLMETTPQINFD